MSLPEPSLTIGIEEEYLLVDRQTRDLAAAPPEMMRACEQALAGQVSPEFLQCQIEVGTRVCRSVQEARNDLAHLRSGIAEIAGRFGLAPIAASTHPFGQWESQRFTDRERYQALARDLAGVGRRMLICGLHVHIAVEDEELRIDLFNQLTYFLPHLLALSTSSPFWEGQDSGLKSYRLSIFDALPRTGLPPQFASFSEYGRTVRTLVNTGIIEDATKVWWDLRPSARFPTLEMRICDVPSLLVDTITVAALARCVVRMLYRLRRENQRWRQYDRFLVNENRWSAQRYGMEQGLIDFGRGELVPYSTLLDELLALIRPDAEALGCVAEVEGARAIVARGTSADRQRNVFRDTVAAGGTADDALRAVVDALIAETVA